MFAIDCTRPDYQDQIASALHEAADGCTVYYGIHNLATKDADHTATIVPVKDGYRYSIAGHGLSPRAQVLAGLDSVLARVVADNRFFNMTDRLYVEPAAGDA